MGEYFAARSLRWGSTTSPMYPDSSWQVRPGVAMLASRRNQPRVKMVKISYRKPEVHYLEQHFVQTTNAGETKKSTNLRTTGTSDEDWTFRSEFYLTDLQGWGFSAMLHDNVNGPSSGYRDASVSVEVPLPPFPFPLATPVLLESYMTRVGPQEYLVLCQVITSGTALADNTAWVVVHIDTTLVVPSITATATPAVVTHSARVQDVVVNDVWTGSGVQWWTLDDVGAVVTITSSLDAQTVTLGSDLTLFGFEYDRIGLGVTTKQYVTWVRTGVIHSTPIVGGMYSGARNQVVSDAGSALVSATEYSPGGVAVRSNTLGYDALSLAIARVQFARPSFPVGHPSHAPVVEGFFVHAGTNGYAYVPWGTDEVSTICVQIWMGQISPPVIS